MMFPKESSSEAPAAPAPLLSLGSDALVVTVEFNLLFIFLCRIVQISRFWVESNQAGALGKDSSQQLWWCWG